MFERRIPEWLRHAPAPSVARFGILSALDAATRGILISVFPVAMYRALASAEAVSAVYLLAGVLSLIATLMLPYATRWIPRQWMFTGGCLAYIAAAPIMVFGGTEAAPFALAVYTMAAATVFLCLNAYVLDYVAQAELGRCETLRMFYAALCWAVGPVLGVWLADLWQPLPFLLSAGFAAGLCAVFWFMRLGNGKLIRRARKPATNPVAYLGRFFAQPRLVAGYLFAMIRSCAWWAYVVYLPIFAINNGLGEKTAGIALSITNSLLFTAPLMRRAIEGRPVRSGVRFGFAGAALLFVASALLAGWPWVTVACLFAASAFLIFLDICGGLPFLMAVKPSERTEMSAVYSSYRDVSGIVTPAMAGAILLVQPVGAVFGVVGVTLFGAWAIAGRIHVRLGLLRRTGDRMPCAPGE